MPSPKTSLPSRDPAVRAVERITYCAGSPALRPHIFAQQVLDPGEQRIVSVELPRGHYRVAGAYAHQPWDFVASAVGFVTECEVLGDAQTMTGRPDIVRAGAAGVAVASILCCAIDPMQAARRLRAAMTSADRQAAS